MDGAEGPGVVVVALDPKNVAAGEVHPVWVFDVRAFPRTFRGESVDLLAAAHQNPLAVLWAPPELYVRAHQEDFRTPRARSQLLK